MSLVLGLLWMCLCLSSVAILILSVLYTMFLLSSAVALKCLLCVYEVFVLCFCCVFFSYVSAMFLLC